jgi:hypothetical protein
MAAGSAIRTWAEWVGSVVVALTPT